MSQHVVSVYVHAFRAFFCSFCILCSLSICFVLLLILVLGSIPILIPILVFVLVFCVVNWSSACFVAISVSVRRVFMPLF